MADLGKDPWASPADEGVVGTSPQGCGRRAGLRGARSESDVLCLRRAARRTRQGQPAPVAVNRPRTELWGRLLVHGKLKAGGVSEDANGQHRPARCRTHRPVCSRGRRSCSSSELKDYEKRPRTSTETVSCSETRVACVWGPATAAPLRARGEQYARRTGVVSAQV